MVFSLDKNPARALLMNGGVHYMLLKILVQAMLHPAHITFLGYVVAFKYLLGSDQIS